MPGDPILIVGAGIVGLTLGQALKKKGIPFEIYERDPTPDARGQGWAITLHWALEYLRQIVPDETLARIQAVQVDPDVARHDNGTFLFINLATGEPRFKIPPSARWRVSREGMRRALLAGIEDRVHWGKRVVGVDTTSTPPDRVRLVFDSENENDDDDDGSGRVTGRMVIGVEGSRSIVRRVLRPDAYSNEQLPIRFTGVAVDLTPAEVQPLRSMDPLLFQGCEPESGTFFWFSMLETPLGNGTAGTGAERFRAQVCMSWPVRSEGDEVACTDEGRLANMKRRADRFTPFLRNAVQDIPQGTPVTEITLADWECLDWDNRDGRVTLAGDAAHAMTMYRGEAANHGLLDAFNLVQAIGRIYSGQATPKHALDEYEGAMRKRTKRAVRLSRQACHDAHTWERLNKESAILTKRSIEGRDMVQCAALNWT